MTAAVTPLAQPDYAAEQDAEEAQKLHEGMDYCREDGHHTWVRLPVPAVWHAVRVSL